MYIRLRNPTVWLNKKKQLKYRRMMMTTTISALQITQTAAVLKMMKNYCGKSTSS